MKVKKLIGIKALMVATAMSLGVACSPAHASELTDLDMFAIKNDSRLEQTITCNLFAGYAKVAHSSKEVGMPYAMAKDTANSSAANMSGARGVFLTGIVDMVYKNDFSSDVVVGVVELMCHDLYENLKE